MNDRQNKAIKQLSNGFNNYLRLTSSFLLFPTRLPSQPYHQRLFLHLTTPIYPPTHLLYYPLHHTLSATTTNPSNTSVHDSQHLPPPQTSRPHQVAAPVRQLASPSTTTTTTKSSVSTKTTSFCRILTASSFAYSSTSSSFSSIPTHLRLREPVLGSRFESRDRLHHANDMRIPQLQVQI